MISTVVLEKMLESLLDCKEIQPVHPKGNQSWIFIRLMLKLKLQYFGQLMQRTDSSEKTLMLGKTDGRRGRENRGWDGWMASPTQWTRVSVNSRSWRQTETPVVLQSTGLQSWLWLSDWTELKVVIILQVFSSFSLLSKFSVLLLHNLDKVICILS